MSLTIVPSKQDVQELEGRWVYCENGIWLPPQKSLVPVVVRSTSGGFSYCSAALWMTEVSYNIEAGKEYTIEQVVDMLASLRWCTAMGRRIPANVYAWYVVPGFDETKMYTGDLYGKL